MHKSKATDLQGVPKNRLTFGHSVPIARAINAHRLFIPCPSLVHSMPDACSVDAHRLFTECPLDGQDRPPDDLLQNGVCDFIPNPACQSFFLFIVCIGILYILEEMVLKFSNCTVGITQYALKELDGTKLRITLEPI